MACDDDNRMISAFYRRYGTAILATVLLSLPVAGWIGENLPCNNDIETWLPANTDSRRTYEQFRQTFGADEFVAVGYQSNRLTTQEAEALCRRFERLEGVEHCWSRERLVGLMSEMQVNEADTDARITKLVQSESGEFHALLVVLNHWGIAHRSAVVSDVEQQIQYCDVGKDTVSLAGAPVVVTELDRLGNRHRNKVFFAASIVICFALLLATLRDWKLSVAIVILTIWAIEMTLTSLAVVGAPMNFILSALPVLVMVFTLAVSIHLLHSYHNAHESEDPLTDAVKTILSPALFATLTTVIGLVSLSVSSIGPVRMFGLYGAIGSVFALIAGLGVLPAVIQKLGYLPPNPTSRKLSTARAGQALVNNARKITFGVVALLFVCALGLPSLRSEIDPLKFLPDDSQVLTDNRRVERNLTSYDSIEMIVDFGVSKATLFDRLEEVHRIEELVASHPAVGHTMSLVSFMPTEALNGEMPPASLISQARSRHDDGAFVADAERKWRISARLVPNARIHASEVVDSIQAMTAGAPITITGLTRVLDTAQRDIFRGFWESFAVAFVLISFVMLVALRSVKAGLLAMIPNLTPIAIVFGVLGWVDIPVDIGTMMTASIALGLAVDGTFHFLFAHHRIAADVEDPVKCTHLALCKTGAPILQAAVISAIGMLALTLSNFQPTSKFGLLMFALLLTALLGDLILLPAILALKKRKATPTEHGNTVIKGPHYQKQGTRSAVRM